jgi:hypothetical protein
VDANARNDALMPRAPCLMRQQIKSPDRTRHQRNRESC